MGVTFKFGDGPVQILIDGLENLAQPLSAADMLYVLEQQKSRILSRTARGVDFEEKPFAPYSTNGPFYYYPSKGTKNRAANVKRVFSKLDPSFQAKKTKTGIKFPNYGAFKQSLGRSGVDLMGPRAPHMLQAIVAKVSSDLSTATLGIYGAEADRASGHNEGTAHLPKREFFAISKSDIERMTEDLERFMSARLEKIG